MSLAAVPMACGPGAAGGALINQPIPVDDDVDGLDPPSDDSGPGINPGAGGCEAFARAAATCLQGNNSGSPGYDYDSDYGDAGYYEPPNTPDDYCAEYLGQLTEQFGAACAAAADSVFACLATFACQDLDPTRVDELCAGPAEAAERACALPGEPPDTSATNATFDSDPTDPSDATDPTDPTMGDGCPSSGRFTDGETCLAQFDCPDGNEYEVTCVAPGDGGLYACVCQMNGEQTSSFEIENPCNTIWESLAATSCGFPTAP